MRKRFLALLLALLLILTLALPAAADFGDFGGDSDYGGWDDYGWDDDDDYDYDYDDDDDDYYYHSSGSSYGDFDVSDTGSTILGAILLVIILLPFMLKKTSKKARPAPRPAPSNLRPMYEYLKLDPEFDEAAFREKIANLYVQMQNCWTAKDISSLRPHFTDAFFTQMDRQLNQKRQTGVTNYVERIAVLGVNPKGFRQDNGTDHMIVEVRTRIVDYTLKDGTGELVSGSKTKEKFMVYEWDLCRASGQKTQSMKAPNKIICPSCGAPLDLNASAKCPYCDSVYRAQATDWALCAIKGISQRTQ